MFTNPFLLPLSYIAGKIMERKGNNMDTNLEESKILFTAGDGTAENPFIISDREGLEAVSDNLSAHYKLGADIDLLGEAFTPIGTSSLYFRGSLDGDGHVLRGLKVSAAGYAGLFGKASYATFKNLKIEGAEIESTGSYAGILAGSINGGSLTGCSVSGTLVGTSLTGGKCKGAGMPNGGKHQCVRIHRGIFREGVRNCGSREVPCFRKCVRL